MKITVEQLRRVIKEEVEAVLGEARGFMDDEDDMFVPEPIDMKRVIATLTTAYPALKKAPTVLKAVKAAAAAAVAANQMGEDDIIRDLSTKVSGGKFGKIATPSLRDTYKTPRPRI